MTHLRVRFTKLGKVRFTSHRDVARMFERAFRRADLPLAYTEGFSPRPRISFGLALSTGYESLAEYLDADLQVDTGFDFEDTPLRLTAALPGGVDVVAVAPIDAHALSLQQDVTSTSWRIELVTDERPEVEAAALAALAAPTIIATRTRKGQQSTDDLRPSLLGLAVLPAGDVSHATSQVVLTAELATQPRALRPAELIGAVWPAVEDVRVLRTHQWIERDGARWEPLPSGATDALHAQVRAS